MKKTIEELRTASELTLKKYENRIDSLQAELDSKKFRLQELSNAVATKQCRDCDRYRDVIERLQRGTSFNYGASPLTKEPSLQ